LRFCQAVISTSTGASSKQECEKKQEFTGVGGDKLLFKADIKMFADVVHS